MRAKVKKPSSGARQKVKRQLRVFKRSAVLRANEMARMYAGAIAAEMVDILVRQRYKLKPLSPEYLVRKVKKKLDRRILIATKFYLKNIAWWEAGGRVYFGVRPGVMLSDNKDKRIKAPKKGSKQDIPLAVLVRAHEFGNKRLPARPHWRSLVSRYVRKFPEFAEAYRKAVRSDIKRA